MIDTNMYDTDDVVTTVRTAVAGTKLPVVKGYVTEIELNGKKVELINAEYIKELHKTIRELTNKLMSAERNINTLTNNFRKLNQTVNNMARELDRKIDRGI